MSAIWERGEGVALRRTFSTRARNIPQRDHVLPRNDLVARPAEHEDRGCRRYPGHLRRRVPPLEAEEREEPYDRPVAHHAGEGLEGVFDNEGRDLPRANQPSGTR